MRCKSARGVVRSFARDTSFFVTPFTLAPVWSTVRPASQRRPLCSRLVALCAFSPSLPCTARQHTRGNANSPFFVLTPTISHRSIETLYHIMTLHHAVVRCLRYQAPLTASVCSYCWHACATMPIGCFPVRPLCGREGPPRALRCHCEMAPSREATAVLLREAIVCGPTPCSGLPHDLP